MLMNADPNTLEFWVVLIILIFVKFWWLILLILAVLAILVSLYAILQDGTVKPTFSSPNEITALIMVALTKNEGDLTQT